MLSKDIQILPHNQGLHDHQNLKNEQLTNGSKEVTMAEEEKSAGKPDYSEQNENVNELTYNDSEQRASNEEHLKNTGRKTAGRDNKHDAETIGLTNSLGVDNKAFDCYEKDFPTCSPDQVTVAKVDEVNTNDVLSKSSEQNHDDAVSETVTNKKPSVSSCDLESALSATRRVKTVRAWLRDPRLYKVIPVFHSE